MGTPEFARVSLSALFDNGYPIVGIFSQPDKPFGRGRKIHSPPCAVFAKEKNLPLYQPNSLKDKNTIQEIEKLNPDFIIVAAYGKILPQKILDAAKIDCINVHASLLPKFRGAAPIQWAVVHGEKETGVCLMKMVQKMDAGPVYVSETLSIESKDNAQSLTEKLAPIGAQLLVNALPLIQNAEVKAEEQDEAQVTYAPSISKEQGRIDWNQPTNVINNLIRGMNPWPCAYTLIDNKRLKIYDSDVLPEKPNESPGKIYLVSPKGLHVACRNSALCLTEVQLEGKKRMAASDFARGIRLKEGKKLG